MTEHGIAAQVRILRGNPTDAEIAALLAVLAALGVGGPRGELAGHAQPRLRRRHGRPRYQHRSAGSWRRHQ
ncbi:MAG TPA: acyl-CoA carboxylase epsilon subunit [Actinocrinis sp.]|jgi:hypothetical protein|uniref:acyl-CoA carboxylase epsilon subunit n=1 Tax=Actinocrinis sp. TaxID=1920516 RepID=UPI002D70B617|nr:acyl-CoA carboxylase epsilon subunit [Actinocrinis sp.]HZU56487.1 acyl-CoA carboxylase epsilon subunit [Actinocrinis sp.]